MPSVHAVEGSDSSAFRFITSRDIDLTLPYANLHTLLHEISRSKVELEIQPGKAPSNSLQHFSNIVTAGHMLT